MRYPQCALRVDCRATVHGLLRFPWGGRVWTLLMKSGLTRETSTVKTSRALWVRHGPCNVANPQSIQNALRVSWSGPPTSFRASRASMVRPRINRSWDGAILWPHIRRVPVGPGGDGQSPSMHSQNAMIANLEVARWAEGRLGISQVHCPEAITQAVKFCSACGCRCLDVFGQ